MDNPGPNRLPQKYAGQLIGAWFSEPSKSALQEEYFGPAITAISGFKVWNGTSWAIKPVKVWNGTAWVIKPLKRWNGTAWVLT